MIHQRSGEDRSEKYSNKEAIMKIITDNAFKMVNSPTINSSLHMAGRSEIGSFAMLPEWEVV